MNLFLRRWGALRFALSVGWAGWLPVSGENAPPEARGWIRFDAPMIELYSRGSEADSRLAWEHLLRVRSLFLDLVGLPEREPLPLTIYLFRWPQEVAPYVQGNLRVAGFHHAGPVRSVVGLHAGAGRPETLRTAAHEYVHHLVGTTFGAVPLWYNEGWATLLQGVELDARGAVFGQPGPYPDLMRSRDLIPLEEFFAMTIRSPRYWGQGGHVGHFHAQSWTLLHYLLFAEHGLPPAGVRAWLDHVGRSGPAAAPAELRDEFRRRMGIDYPDLERRLVDYVAAGRFRQRRYDRKRSEIDRHGAAQVATAEMGARLDELGARTAGPGQEAALGRLRERVRRDAGDLRAQEVLGAVAWWNGDAAGARAHWAAAGPAGNDNPALARRLGATP